MDDNHAEHDKKTKERILADVDTYGFHVALLEPTDYLPGFIYTIGVYKNYGHPEIMCFGLKTEVMHTIVNEVVNRMKAGESINVNKPYSGFLEGYEVQFLPVDKEYYQYYLGYAAWFYDRTFDFPAIQLLWPDKAHKWPWEDNFNEDWKFKQPLLDRSTDFMFYEERRTGVFTTKQALEGEPILYVYHNEDGAWQFHTSDEPNLADVKLVCLEEIVKLDSTINELFQLEYGYSACRNSINDEWIVLEHPDTPDETQE